MALATDAVMACIIFYLVFLEEHDNILERPSNRDENIQQDTSFNIVSLLPALSIWKYPSFEAIPQSRITSIIYGAKLVPSCEPIISFIERRYRSIWPSSAM